VTLRTILSFFIPSTAAGWDLLTGRRVARASGAPRTAKKMWARLVAEEPDDLDSFVAARNGKGSV
jgi:hypothetical protein